MRISFLLLVFAILAISCKKDPVTPPHQNAFSASVNGTAFVPSDIVVAVSGSSLAGARAVGVNATDVNGHKIFLYMYDYDGTKSTFNLVYNTGTEGLFTLQDLGIGTAFSVSKSGQINIASFDKTNYKPGEVTTGTFQFETDDSVGKYSITNGHFSLLVPPN
jgi:hypothetical protein